MKTAVGRGRKVQAEYRENLAQALQPCTPAPWLPGSVNVASQYPETRSTSTPPEPSTKDSPIDFSRKRHRYQYISAYSITCVEQGTCIDAANNTTQPQNTRRVAGNMYKAYTRAASPRARAVLPSPEGLADLVVALKRSSCVVLMRNVPRMFFSSNCYDIPLSDLLVRAPIQCYVSTLYILRSGTGAYVFH